MRKSTILFAVAALMSTGAMAQSFGNPKDAEGNYIVKWDLEKGAFAESNDWEIDETFVFAIDVTGTGYESALAETGRGSIGRGLAYDLYITSAPEGTTGKANIDGRLFQISDNVYGMVVNFFQQHVTRLADDFLGPNEDYTFYTCLEPGAVVSWSSNIFPFGWSETDPGAEWWNAIAEPIQGVLNFSCAPYTGTKTSPDYFFGDIVPAEYTPFPGLDPGSIHSMCDGWGGYSPIGFYDEAVGGEGDESIVKSISNSPVISSIYYNLQGQRINNVPENGIFIRKDIKADGSVKSVKIAK